MAASITPGYTWADGNQITSARLNTAITGASISGIDSTNMASAASIVTISDSAPSSPVEGQLWFDTSPAAGEGILRYYNGAHWNAVGRGFFGYNSSGSTIDAGMIVKRSPGVSGTGDFREEIAATTTRHDFIAGVALTQIVNGATGIVINNSRSLAVLTTGTITAGDPLVPSTTAGTATTGADANYGKFYGAGVSGVFTKSGTGSTNEAAIFQAPPATGVSFRTPVKLLDGVIPSADNTWSGSFGTAQYLTWSVTPPSVIARLIQFKVIDVTAAADTSLVFAVRQRGSTLTVATGTPHAAGVITSDGGSSTDNESFDGQLWIPTDPAGGVDAVDRAEYLVKIETAANIGNVRVTVWEVAVMCGGRFAN